MGEEVKGKRRGEGLSEIMVGKSVVVGEMLIGWGTSYSKGWG